MKLEENRRGNTRNLFRKIGDIKRIYAQRRAQLRTKMVDLVDAKETKKRWKEYMKSCPKKIQISQILTMVWSVTQSQTFWRAKSSGP